MLSLATISAALARLQSELLALQAVVDGATFRRYLLALVRSAPEVLRRRSLSPADAALAPGPTSLRLLGVDYELSGVPFGGVREIFVRRVYQPQADWRGPSPPNRFLPSAGELVVDLGANVGLFSLLCAKRGATVLAVEAQSGYAAELQRLFARNGCAAAVRTVCALVGAQRGLFADRQTLEHGSHYRQPPPPMTMDELLADSPGREVALLKCDIEGSEFALFAGDLGWLRRVRRLAMEVHHDYGDAALLLATLQAHGFAAWLTDASGHNVARSVGSDGYLFAERLPNPGDPL